MTTTELIKILKDNECGGISHKPREISLIINGKYMENPQITLSSTGDGICGAEIDLDVDGDFTEEREPKPGHWIETYDEIDSKYSRHCYKCSECNEYAHYFIGGSEDWWDVNKPHYCPNCGCRMGEVSQ